METFKIGVSVELLDKATHGIVALSRNLQNAHGKAAALHRQLFKIQRDMAIGGALQNIGVSIAGGLTKAVNAAGELELALKGVQIAGRYSNDEMKKMSETVFQVSAMAATSAKEVARFAALIRSSSAGMSMGELQRVLPIFTKFADVMHFGPKQVSFEESIRTGVRFAHLLPGGLTGPGLTKGLDKLFIASQFTAGSPNELLTSMRKFSPIASRMGVSVDEQIMLSALMENLGFGGSGGTLLKNMMVQSIPGTAKMTKFLHSKKGAGMKALGLIDKKGKSTVFDYMGRLDTGELFSKLGQASEKMDTQTFISSLMNVFNTRGGMAAAILSDSDAQQRLRTMLSEVAKFQGDAKSKGKTAVEVAQEDMFNSFTVKLRTLKTNIENIFLKALLPKLPAITAWLEKAAVFAAHLVDTMTPERATTMLKIVAAIGALSIAAGVTLKISALARAIRLLGGFVGMGTGAGAAGFGVQKVFVTNPGFGSGGKANPNPGIGVQEKVGAVMAGAALTFWINDITGGFLDFRGNDPNSFWAKRREASENDRISKKLSTIGKKHAARIRAAGGPIERTPGSFAEQTIAANPELRDLFGDKGKNAVSIAPGAIIINQNPGESQIALAKRVLDEIVKRMAGASGFSAGSGQGVIGTPAVPGTP